MSNALRCAPRHPVLSTRRGVSRRLDPLLTPPPCAGDMQEKFAAPMAQIAQDKVAVRAVGRGVAIPPPGGIVGRPRLFGGVRGRLGSEAGTSGYHVCTRGLSILYTLRSGKTCHRWTVYHTFLPGGLQLSDGE